MKVILLGLFAMLLFGKAQAQHYGKPIQDSLHGKGARLVQPPTVIELKQNFPNPFTRSTQIHFTAATELEVTFKVHDLLGNLVLQRNLSAIRGNNSFVFERGDLPSGFYFYTLEFGSTILTKRMMIRD
jgi:hypothetical protein